MCGVCGFVSGNISSADKQQVILKMLAAISYRGPDDEGFFIEGKIALGAKRLSIIDLAQGHQPIHNEDKSLWIVYNGEVYNFAQLRESLIKKGHIFYTQSDTEVVLHLYEEYGLDCLDKLNGMFVFAVWDKNNEELFVARDHFGIKPLYYSEFQGSFLFASELKSILKFPGFIPNIDPAALDQYLTFEYVPTPRSIFKGIYKLPAGHFLSYKNKKLAIKKYWDLDLSVFDNRITEQDAQEKLLSLLNSSVKRHLVSDVPVGIFLSGGIDSSMLTALASAHVKGRIKTFSMGFIEESFDESRHIKEVADRFSTDHYHCVFDSRELLNLIPQAAMLLDEPFADASFFSAYALSKFTKQKVTVALSGEGADELFAGYPTYQAHKLAQYYLMIPALIREHVIEKVVVNLPVSMVNFSFDFKAKKFVSGVSLPVILRHIYWMGAFNEREKKYLYTDELKQRIKEEVCVEGIEEMAKRFLVNTGFNLNELQYFDVKTYLQDDLLVKADRASMYNSLEVRVPYLDHELAEFVFGLAPNMRLRHFRSKYIFKKAASRYLPGNIISRKKKGFGIPVAFWVKKELRSFVYGMLESGKIRKEGLFNWQAIENILQDHSDNKADNRKKIWTLFMFELWLERYLSF